MFDNLKPALDAAFERISKEFNEEGVTVLMPTYSPTQGRLLSESASTAMQGIFDSPAIPHDEIKFVKALAPRGLHLRRKWGTWQDWRHAEL